MIKLTAAAASLLLCAALLVACGDSGSGSSSTKTATVPTGKLGDNFDRSGYQYRSCMDYISPGGVPHKVLLEFRVRAPLDCATATKALASHLYKGTAVGWDCHPMVGTNGRTQVYTVCQGSGDREFWYQIRD